MSGETRTNVRESSDKCPRISDYRRTEYRRTQFSNFFREGMLRRGKPGARAGNQTNPPPVSDAQWQAFAQRWNSSAGERYRSPRQPPAFAQRMVDPEWLALALLAIDRLPACKWFATPVNLPQFCKPDFVDEVLAGKYVGAKPAPRISPRLGLTDVAPPREFAGDDAKRFEETRQREIQKLRAASGA